MTFKQVRDKLLELESSYLFPVKRGAIFDKRNRDAIYLGDNKVERKDGTWKLTNYELGIEIEWDKDTQEIKRVSLNGEEFEIDKDDLVQVAFFNSFKHFLRTVQNEAESFFEVLDEVFSK